MEAANKKSNEMEVIRQIEELRTDARSCKNRHFAAAERNLRYHKVATFVALALELIVTVILFDALREYPTSLWLRQLVAFSSLLAVFLIAIQTKFGLDKHAEGHRNIANRYVEISHKCKRLLGRHHDLALTANELWYEFQNIDSEYNLINRDADKFVPSRSDDKKAENRKERTPYEASGLKTPNGAQE